MTRSLRLDRYRRFQARLPREMVERLERDAKQNRRTMNGELAAIIKARLMEARER